MACGSYFFELKYGNRIIYIHTFKFGCPFPNTVLGSKEFTQLARHEFIQIGAAGGFIIHDWKEKFVQASAFNLGRSLILVAEATAMRNGIKAAVQVGITHI